MKHLFVLLLLWSCNQNNTPSTQTPTSPSDEAISYLALGDSYTKGESVCDDCGYPMILAEQLEDSIGAAITVNRIAETGWTTTDLKVAISEETLTNDFDVVTLLIGVNNQYQNKPFSLYIKEFPELLDQAIGFSGKDVDRVVVLSIPDYAFTPYGQKSSEAERISNELDAYNAFAKKETEKRGVRFLEITDITRLGNEEPKLVATDGLHPSKLAYERFVDRLLPIVVSMLD